MVPIVDVAAISVTQDGSVKINTRELQAFVTENMTSMNTTQPNSSACKNLAGCANVECTGNNTACNNTGCGL